MYAGMRFQDAHPQGVDVSEAVSAEGGLYRFPRKLDLLDGRKVSCDTCHTRHMPGPEAPYLVMAAKQNNGLCDQCHHFK